MQYNDMDEIERRQQDRRQDHETAAQLHEAIALQRAFGSDAAQRFLALRGIDTDIAQDALLEAYDRRQAARRARNSAI